MIGNLSRDLWCNSPRVAFGVGALLREWLAFGNLNNGLTNGGLSYVNGNNGLTNTNWNIGGRIFE